jgi:hypothetical protein
MAVLVGLVPAGSEYYRPLSPDTVLNNLPFIGTNMIYFSTFLLILGIITAVSWRYGRYQDNRDTAAEKLVEAPMQQPKVKQ